MVLCRDYSTFLTFVSYTIVLARAEEGRSVMDSRAKITVAGVGGAGCNILSRLIDMDVKGINLVAINTDLQALQNVKANVSLQIGKNTSRGLGCRGDVRCGGLSAEENIEQIREALQGTDIVFIVAGLGGGTGTGASPVIARISRELGAATIALVSKPFSFEGSRRKNSAERCVDLLRREVDTLIAIPLDRFLAILPRDANPHTAFTTVDEFFVQIIIGIHNIVTLPYFLEFEFEDLKSFIKKAGATLVTIGRGKGDNRARIAAKEALENPLLEVSIYGAKNIFFNVNGDASMTLSEIQQAIDEIKLHTNPETNVSFGATVDASLDNEIEVTLLASGFPSISGVGYTTPSNTNLINLNVTDCLSPEILVGYVGTFVQALSALQHIIDELRGHSLSVVKIQSISVDHDTAKDDVALPRAQQMMMDVEVRRAYKTKDSD
jgi:cell division protein FtsZ